MGQRRMISNRIANSTRFLQMPADSQLLYFHMVIRADDDGVVETYPVIRLLGSTPDAFKVLEAKGYIRPLNDEQVVVITDWGEHNYIRADRKVDSIYLPLLKEKYPDVPVIEPKPRSDVVDNSLRVHGQSTDGISKVKLSKDKLSKDKLSKDKVEKIGFETPRRLAQLLYDEIMKNELAPTFKNNPPHLESWANDIDKLIRIDGIPENLIQTTIEKVVKHVFWSKNVLSGAKLRKHYNKLYLDLGLGKCIAGTPSDVKDAVEENKKRRERMGL